MNLSLKLIEHLVYPNKSLHEPLKRQYCWRKKPRLLEIGRLNERIEIQPNKRDRHKEKNRVVNYNQKVIEMHMFFVLFVCSLSIDEMNCLATLSISELQLKTISSNLNPNRWNSSVYNIYYVIDTVYIHI